MIPQHLGKLVAGELRTLIGIEDVGPAEPGERLAQRLDAEPCRQRVRQPPGQHRRVAQSMIATRYKNPCCIGM